MKDVGEVLSRNVIDKLQMFEIVSDSGHKMDALGHAGEEGR